MLLDIVNKIGIPITAMLGVFTLIKAVMLFGRRDYQGCGVHILMTLFITTMPAFIAAAGHVTGNGVKPTFDLGLVGTTYSTAYMGLGVHIMNVGLGIVRDYGFLHVAIAYSGIKTYNQAMQRGDVMSLVWWLIFYSIFMSVLF